MPLNNRIVLLLLTAALLLPAAHAGAIFTPTPSTISGAPGDTVGWGFTISNDTNYLLITSADFTPATPLGTFTDFIGQFNFIVVGPSPESTSVSQTFDPSALTGVGSFLISSSATPGSVITGLLTLTYDLFSHRHHFERQRPYLCRRSRRERRQRSPRTRQFRTRRPGSPFRQRRAENS